LIRDRATPGAAYRRDEEYRPCGMFRTPHTGSAVGTPFMASARSTLRPASCRLSKNITPATHTRIVIRHPVGTPFMASARSALRPASCRLSKNITSPAHARIVIRHPVATPLDSRVAQVPLRPVGAVPRSPLCTAPASDSEFRIPNSELPSSPAIHSKF